MASVPPAARRLLQSLHALNDIVQDTTVMVQALLATEACAKKHTNQMVHQAVALKAVLEDISSNVSTITYNWIERWTAVGFPAAAELHFAHTLCIASFRKFLSAAMAAMQRLEVVLNDPKQGITDSSSHRPRMFMIMWTFTYDLCDWLEAWPLLLSSPESLTVRFTALYPTLNKFLAWLLKLVRHGSIVQKILQTYVTEGQVWQVYVFRFMDLAILSLRALCKLPPAFGYSSVNSLPTDFIATLCCLACEADPRPQGLTHSGSPSCPEICLNHYTQIICILQVVLDHFFYWRSGSNVFFMSANAAARAALGTSSGLNPDFFGAASVEVMKRALIFCPSTAALTLENTLDAQRTLYTLLMHPSSAPSSDSSPSHRVSAPGSNSSTFGRSNNSRASIAAATAAAAAAALAAAAIINLTPRRQTSNHHLLSVLLKCSQRYPEALGGSTSLIGIVATKTGADLTPQTISLFVTVLRHCSLHLCRSIQHQRSTKQQEKLPGRRNIVTPPPPAPYEIDNLQVLMLTMMGCCGQLSLLKDSE